MAKPKIPNIKQKSIGGYGLKSPYTSNPSDSNIRSTSPASTGSGDYYGSGVRNPMAKLRDVSGNNPVSKSSLGKPPKSLA